MRRIACRVWSSLTTSLVLVSTASTQVSARQSIHPNASPTAQATPATAAWIADLHFIADSVTSRHPAFFNRITKSEFAVHVATLERRIPSMPVAEVPLEFQRLIALAHDDHTTFALGFDPRAPLTQLPIRLHLFADGLYVTAAAKGYASIAGARVIRIGNRTADDAMKRIAPYVSSQNESWIRVRGPDLLVYREALRAAGIIADTGAVKLVVATAMGEQTISLHALGALPHPRMPAPEAWVQASRTGAARVQPDDALWFGMVPGTRTAYARMHVIGDEEKMSFPEWTRALLAFLDSAKPDRLAIDLRDNNGGDNTLLAPLIDGIVARPWLNTRGKLFVLVGSETTSAAQNLATRMERRTHATFVGDETGSAPNHYGDPSPMHLPNTQLTLFLSSRAWTDSEPSDKRTTIKPGIKARATFSQWKRRFDPALEAVLRVPLPN